MAVNQAQVDLIKTSIKRLLMDIRERMNEFENPFTLVASSGSVSAGSMPAPSDLGADIDGARKSALEAREAALDARESQLDATQAKMETENKKESPGKGRSAKRVKQEHDEAQDDDEHLSDQQALAAFRLHMPPQGKTAIPDAISVTHSAIPSANEKLMLQKVYKLFKWTHQSVKKFGHDRLEIMLESYRAMGYITKESSDEIREISRLMPANLGEEHEVGPDEFVAELYALNRILAPNDTSLDRDMIEVMMEQRQQESPGPARREEEKIDLSGNLVVEKKATKSKDKEEDWMNLPDRI
jgi:hypothetical protein